VRYFVHQFVFFILLCASVSGFGQIFTQTPASDAAPKAAATQTVSEEVAAAEAAIVKSDWKTAEAKLDAWLAAHPTDARALFDAGYVADEQDRQEAAASLYRRAVEANPQSFEAHVELGLLLARQNKLPEARQELAAATQLDPGEAGTEAKARAWRELAEIDRATNPAKASEDLLEALKLSPETPSDTLLAAELAAQTGQLDAAEQAYRRMLAKDPKFAAANAGLAHLLIARKQYPEAETLLRAALGQTPDDTALTAQLATVLAAEDKAEALPLFEKLHEAHPKDLAITRMLATVLDDAGDVAGSDKLYVTLLAAKPDDTALLVAHGQNLIRQLRYADAYATFSKATRLDEGNGEGWSGLAFAALKIGQPSVTIHALTMRSKLLADNPSSYFLWAMAYDALQNKAQAANYYHHFLDSSAGKLPNQEWQARQRLLVLEKKQ
jgi:tetratricopeptide (TPR) repeat protein